MFLGKIMSSLSLSNLTFDATEYAFPKGFLNSASAREIQEMLYSLLESGVIKEDIIRAKKLLNATIPVLVWIRDEKNFPLYAAFIPQALTLKWLDRVAHKAQAIFLKLPADSHYEWHKNIHLGKNIIDVNDMPDQFFSNIATYLEDLPGYELSARLELQSGSAPFHAHDRATMFFMPVQNIKN